MLGSAPLLQAKGSESDLVRSIGAVSAVVVVAYEQLRTTHRLPSLASLCLELELGQAGPVAVWCNALAHSVYGLMLMFMIMLMNTSSLATSGSNTLVARAPSQCSANNRVVAAPRRQAIQLLRRHITFCLGGLSVRRKAFSAESGRAGEQMTKSCAIEPIVGCARAL